MTRTSWPPGHRRALAGVDALVGREVRVDLEPEKSGLAGDPDVLGGEVDVTHAGVVDDRQRGALALGDQQLPLAQRADVPRVVEAVGQPGHLEGGQPLGGELLPAPRRTPDDHGGDHDDEGEQTDDEGESLHLVTVAT